jgi:hypothetical protein
VQAAKKLASLVEGKGLNSLELLKAAKNCEVVFDAEILKAMKEDSERQFAEMKKSMEVSLPLSTRAPSKPIFLIPHLMREIPCSP